MRLRLRLRLILRLTSAGLPTVGRQAQYKPLGTRVEVKVEVEVKVKP
jgi:hypothetical protein